MNQPAFNLEFSRNEVPSITAARSLAEDLAANVPITRQHLSETFTRLTGATDADNRWSLSDTHASVELAQLLYLQATSKIAPGSNMAEAFDCFDRIETLTPIQYNRSEEQVRFQQFSTPLRLAWITARAAALSSGNLTLEPSAGTGMLAFWARQCGSKLALNEIHVLRRDALHALFPDVWVSMHDGELIDEVLDPAICPDTVLINPPYSVGLERGEDGRTGARHLRSAIARLAPGGRAVAIMPLSFDVHALVERARIPLAVRLNVSMDRAFARAGTSISTRLVVIDKVDDALAPVSAHVGDLKELLSLVDALPVRVSHPFPSVPARPFKRAHRMAPRSLGRPVAPVSAISRNLGEPSALEFSPLDQAAPISEQTGHYLPYRPSRMTIPGARNHPTPLVESVAMGSIAAPIVDADSGSTLNKGAKAAALSIFEGTKQRFFAQLLLSMKLPSLHLATGLLLPIWDKLPGDYVRVSRIAAKDGRSMLGREIGVGDIPELAKALGKDFEQSLDAASIASIVTKTGKPLPFCSVEALTIKRSLVNGSQRLELTGWSADRLDWYKAQGCFTEIIRYQTRLFVPYADAVIILGALKQSVTCSFISRN